MKNFKTFNEFREQINEKLISFGGSVYPKFGQVVALAGGAGCYPVGTEYFDGKQWKPIESYSGGDVLVFDHVTGDAFMDAPVSFVDKEVDQFYEIKNRRVSFITSEQHKHLLVNEKTGKFEVKKTIELVDNHNEKARGNKSGLVNSFIRSDAPGIDFSDAEIRLKIALFADGHKLPQENKFRVRFKKQRKIDRFKQHLSDCGITAKVYAEDDYTVFEFYFKDHEKEFESYWFDCDTRQLKIVTDEVIHWDGSTVKRTGRKDSISFISTSEKSVDFVQYAFAATGYSTSIFADSRDYDGKVCKSVHVNHSDTLGISKDNRAKKTTTIDSIEAGNRMYCFETKTGFFVVRQNGEIFVSGNSGKGFVLKNLMGIEGKVLDVDALKELAQKAPGIIKRVKDEFGIDISKDAFPMKNPENVSKLHVLLSDEMKVIDKNKQALFMSVLTAAPDRKPNIIFDVTMKNMKKFNEIAKEAAMLGYATENIHIVWVINDVQVALEQNRARSRTVPEEILMDTHVGAQQTMFDILKDSETLQKNVNGDIVFAFNKAKIDAALVKSDSGGSYIKDANYVYVKRKGKRAMSPSELGKAWLDKIATYTPNAKSWKDLVANVENSEKK